MDKPHFVTANIPVPIEPEKIVYQGLIVEVVQRKMREGDKEKTYEYARRSPGTRLIVISPDQKVLLTKEYRPELKDWDFRLPGGKVFDTLTEYNNFLQSGKDLVAQAIPAAKREAEEEAGIQVIDIAHFATSPCGATMRWDLYYFVVNKFTVAKQSLGQGENVETNWFSLSEAKSICLTGKMSEDRSSAVLLRYLHAEHKL